MLILSLEIENSFSLCRILTQVILKKKIKDFTLIMPLIVVYTQIFISPFIISMEKPGKELYVLAAAVLYLYTQEMK